MIIMSPASMLIDVALGTASIKNKWVHLLRISNYTPALLF